MRTAFIVTGPPGVEDPISAIFDLADRAAGMAPTVRRMYRYTATIVVVWIVLMAFVTIGTLGGAPWLAILSFIGLIVGVLALGLLRQTDRFFGAFVVRHRSIRLLRDADPVVKVPEGRTAIERLARYLAASNPAIEAWVRTDSGAIRYRVTLPAPGREVPFDLVLQRPGSSFWRTFGRGDPGFVILGRTAVEPVGVDQLRQLQGDAQAVASSLPGAILRLILLRAKPAALAEDAYEYAVGHPVELKRGLARFRSTLEIISENPDGTYDFVPHVLGVP